MNTFFTFVVAGLLTVSAYGQTESTQLENQSAMEITEVVFEEIEPSYEEVRFFEKNVPMNKSTTKEILDVITVVDKMVALGQKIWKIVEKGKPNVNISHMNVIDVIPYVNDKPANFSQMAEWSLPAIKKYKLSFKNAYGMTVVSFEYSVIMQYGGGLYNPETGEVEGEYIKGLKLFPSKVEVSWGFDLDVVAEFHSMANVGSYQTPVASATVLIKYTVSSVVKNITQEKMITVTGDGQFVKIN